MKPTDLSSLDLVPTPAGLQFDLKIVPGASRTQIVGLLGTALKLAVAAPPSGGKANACAIALLARTLGVQRGAVTILRGHTNPHKRVAVAGLTAEQARARLATAAKP